MHRIPQEAQEEGKRSLEHICHNNVWLFGQSQCQKLRTTDLGSSEKLWQNRLQDVSKRPYSGCLSW